MAVNKNMSQPKMAGDNGGRKNEGRGRGEEMKGLKKGPWTAAEDTILMEYVKKHGEGNWNAVPKNTGLARCGKSCRLRWANHLRPNLKKGSFSAAEERVIIELHAKLGNKWATMAAQLPGRTDNEIKNYWNTRMKRRHRAGLPLYPLELQKDVAAIHLQPPFHGETYYSSLPFSSLLSPSQPAKPTFNHSLSLFNPMSFSLAVNSLSSNQHDSEFFTTPTSQFKLLGENNGASGLSVPISSAFVAGSSSIFTHRLSQPLSPEALNLNYGRSKLYCNSGFSSVILGSSFEQVIPGLEAELPSIQTPPLSTTIALSGASVGACETNTQTSPANSGLLDALLMEAHAMDRNEKLKDYGSSFTASEKEKQVEEEEDAVENYSDELSSSQSSTGVKTMEGQMEDTESMDDDLMSLLDNFPSTMPQPWPEWYPNIGGDTNKSQASYLPPTSPVMDIRQKAESPAPITSPTACWNDSPRNTQQLA